MAYKITGSVLAVGQTQNLMAKSGNSYQKRDLVIAVRLFDPYTGQPTTDSTNTPKFTFMGDKCASLDQFREGDIVTVSFDISGRSYEKDGKTEYFTEVRPFRAEFNRQSQRQPTALYEPVASEVFYQPQTVSHSSTIDDLPFA